MKIEIYLDGLMLAKQKGRSKANEKDLEKAMELDEEDDS